MTLKYHNKLGDTKIHINSEQFVKISVERRAWFEQTHTPITSWPKAEATKGCNGQ